jgi:hypothetical protein
MAKLQAVVVNVEPEKPKPIQQFFSLTPLKVVEHIKPGNEARYKEVVETLPIGSIIMNIQGEYGSLVIFNCATSKLVANWYADHLLVMKAHEVRSITLYAKEELP